MTRRRLIRAAAGVLLALAAASRSAGADLPEIQRRGTLRVLAVIDEKRPEFFQTKAGAAPGFDHEILDAFVKLHKLELEVVTLPAWDGLLPALLAGRGDVIAGRFTVTESRRKQVSFTREVFPTRNVVITRRPTAPIADLARLRAEKVGTIKGTSMAEAVAAAGVPASNVDDGLTPGSFGDALRQGRVSAAVWGIESAIALRKDDPEIELGMFLGAPGSLAYAVRKDEPELLRALDDYIENLRRTTTWSRLVVKYFGQAAPEILKKARE
ncbi:MAG: substrate-binding periplasmic protein [Vicinamibacteria bacterium]